MQTDELARNNIWFNEIFTNINKKSILDFGGNDGNLLRYNNVNPLLYTCIDIDIDAINIGKQTWPEATWIHSNRFNWMYNSQGTTAFPTLPKTEYNCIWANSIFSHTDFKELVLTLKWFLKLNYNKIAVSVLSMHKTKPQQWFYHKRIEEYGSCNAILKNLNNKNYNCFYFINNDKFITDLEELEHFKCKHLITFYNLDWLLVTLKKNGINATIEFPGNNNIPFVTINN